jgi:phage replication O-like protein O
MQEGKDIQIEDGGFTRIHNAILEILARVRLSPLEYRIVLLVLRKTYGFQKKTDIISISQFEQCGGSRAATITALQNLIRLKVLIRTQSGQSYEYGFNKYFEDWLPEAFETRRPKQSQNFSPHTGKANGTSKADGTTTSKADGTTTSKADGTTTSKADGTHKRKKETIKETPPQKILFGIIAKMCQLDPKLKAKRIGKTASELLQAGYLPEHVEYFGQWWSENDFRGKRGSPPTLAQVEELIMQAKQDYDRKHPAPGPKRTVKVKQRDGTIVEEEV